MKEKARKYYRPEEKVAILRKHLVEKVELSKICEENELQPTIFYRWQREFFEKGTKVFEETEEKQSAKLKKIIEELEGKLSRKNEVLSELMEDYIQVKKKNGI